MSTNQTREDGAADGSKDRFIYATELPSLRKLASDRVALVIHYSHYNDCSNYIPIITYYRDTAERESYEEKVESLRIPGLIANQIKNSMIKAAHELSDWVTHFNKVLFGGSRNFYKPYHVDINWCVWLPNGEIDYLKTARKMLASGKSSEQQKCIVLTEYCMKDEIKEIALDAFPRARRGDGILCYWIHYLENVMHSPRRDRQLVDVSMARYFALYGTLAREYFWNCVGDEERMEIISVWIRFDRFRNRPECALLERLISSLSWHQQRRLLAQKLGNILINLSVYSNSIQCVLWAWKNCKDEMSNEQFAEVVYEILKRWEEYYRDDRSLCPALIEIWETAHDRQKNFASRTKSKDVMDMCLFKCKPSANSLEFLRKFLSLIPVSVRKSIILKQTAEIRHNFGDLGILNEIVNLCLPNAGDKSIFIESIIDSDAIRIHFLNSIRWEKMEKFNLLLPQDAEAARPFMKIFLQSMAFKAAHDYYHIWNIDNWNKLEKIFDESFADDESQGAKLKKRIVKETLVSRLHKCKIDIRHYFYEISKIVEMVFEDVELKKIKNMFAGVFGDLLQSPGYWENEQEFDETNFQRIINWCIGDDETAISKFKERVSCDVIFDRVFYRISTSYCQQWRYFDGLEESLERLNMYLRWYLTSDEKVKIYKQKRLSSCSNRWEILEVVSDRGDEQTLGILLKWFFNGDEARIRKFRPENLKFCVYE